MKQLIILLALSLVSVTVSAREVVEGKGDMSYLKGREFLEKMNQKTQGRYEAIPQSDSENDSANEFHKQTKEMIRLMKSLNGSQQRPQSVEHDADSNHKAHDWDQAYIEKARVFIRRLNDRTNQILPATKPAKPTIRSVYGTR